MVILMSVTGGIVMFKVNMMARKGTNPNYSYELYEFQYLLGIRRFVGTEMIKNLEFVGS